MLLYLVLFLKAVYLCTTMASSYDSCLCSKLFDMLADEKAKLKETNIKLLQLENKIGQLRSGSWQKPPDQKCKYPIAFYARRDNGNTVPASSTVDFKKVFTDTCNTYDNKTSVFTCPVDGVYVFNVWVQDMKQSKHSFLHIMKNSTIVGYIWIEGNNSQPDAGGNTSILKLQKGDRIYVQNGWSNLGGSLNWGFCTFSGFKLY